MPPQYSSMSSSSVMPAGARCTPGFLTRPLTEHERSPFRPLLDDLAHPVQRLHVVLERRTAEQSDLSDVGRTQTRLAALALDRFDHRGLFAADVGAGAAAKMNVGDRTRRIGRHGPGPPFGE